VPEQGSGGCLSQLINLRIRKGALLFTIQKGVEAIVTLARGSAPQDSYKSV
jgi:hypothetical protein